MKRAALWLIPLIFIVSCDRNTTFESRNPAVRELEVNADTGRWYSQQQVDEGRALFAQYCAACHGSNAQATPAWRTPDQNGNYPPPPLNGTAHTWHHTLAVLDDVIRDGGKPNGGVMPAWGSVLDAEQRMSIIAGFQAYWPSETYDMWFERELFSRTD